MPDAQTLWQLEHVTMPGRLSDVCLSIGSEITAVLGTSGAGKTSLLNLLVDFEKPLTGNITFTSPTPDTQHLPVFWVPQDDGLWSHMTVRDHLLALSDKPTSDHWLSLLDLTEHAHKKPDKLSRGQQNRLAVARAMVCGAAVLVMDEPLAHVAQADAMRYWQVIIDAVRENKQAMIFATHEPSRVLAYADRVICMADSKVIEDGPTQQVYHQPQTQTAATLLGPANWFTADEAAHYLKHVVTTNHCVRPEQLRLSPDEQSDLSVQRTQFHGSIQCSSIVNSDNTPRDIWHLPVPGLNVSDRVSLRILSLFVMMLTLWMTGCKPGSNTPQIPVKNTAIWPVPVDDISVPAPRNAKMLPDGSMLVLDTAGRILTYDSKGKVTAIWHMPDNSIGNPEGTCLLKDGRIAVANTHYHRIVFFDMQGNVTDMFGEEGKQPGQFVYPVSVVQDDEGFIYVVEYGGNDRVQKFTADMQYVMTIGKAGTGPGEFQRASGALFYNHKLYVADAINNRILVFDPTTGKHIDTLGEHLLDLPYDLAVDDREHLYVAEYGAGRVTEMDLSGKIIATFGHTGRGGANQFMTPWSLTITPDHKLRIMDTGNRRIVELEL
jgi:ABC-type Fe3+/spermidine/putrescine transport system ATPase subunit/sugar lactone lactonase YvrE